MLFLCRNNLRVLEKSYDKERWSFSLFRRILPVSTHQYIISHTVNVTPQANQAVNCLVNTNPLKDNFMQKAAV